MRAPLLIDEAMRGVRGTLCRCGASKNKPFCDGSHAEVALLATGAPPKGPKVPLSARDGPVQVRPQRNGPLDVEGNVEILSGTGRAIARLPRPGGAAADTRRPRYFATARTRELDSPANGAAGSN